LLSENSDPYGQIVLFIIILILFYNTIFALVKIGIITIQQAVTNETNNINNAIITVSGGGEPVFPTLQTILINMFSWQTYILTHMLALAVLIVIDLLKTAFRG